MKYNDIRNRPQLVVRQIPFDFSENFNAVWNPGKPEWSHMVNGASLTMPYLEPFLIRTTREALKEINNDKLIDEVRGFIAQEGQHFQNHRRYNEMLKANGYPELSEIEEFMTEDFKQLQAKSLQWRLAYTAGFETMTMGITEWLINDRQRLFSGADESVCSLVLWHLVEETEHKNAAYDLYQELYPNGYLARLNGLCQGGFHVAWLSRKVYIKMLKRDGLWRNFKSRMRLYAMISRFFIKAIPAVLRATLPSYHPAKITDPQWVAKWVETYELLPEGKIPLLDTSDPDIPPQFS